jgi:hypothetical protein
MNDLNSNLNSFTISSLYEKEMKGDLDFISTRKDKIIEGFLSIGKEDGRKEEGSDYETGFRFIRYMFKKFFINSSSKLVDYQDILENTCQAFSINEQKKMLPRAMADTTIKGWNKHAIGRIIGFVGTQPNPKGPFVEILINSARKDPNNPYCYPFQAIVLPNQETAEWRWNQLTSLRNLPETIAYPVFFPLKNEYTIEVFKEKFRKDHNKDPGPNALRLLKGLNVLTITKMKAQTTGNCWIKQNKRMVFVFLFIETLTHS